MIPGKTLGTKISNVLIPLFFIILGLASIVGGFAGAGFWLVPLGGLFLWIGIGLIRTGINMNKEEKIKAEKKRIEKEKREKEERERISQLEAGVWMISAADFYRELQKVNIQSLTSEFSLQKATVLARAMLEKAEVPEQYHSIYLKKDKLNELLKAGKVEHYRLSVIEEQTKLAEEERKRTTPIDGNPDYSEKQKLDEINQIYSLHGIAKRKKMLERLIDPKKKELLKLQGKIASFANSDDSAVVAVTAHLISASQENTHNWGLAGGIASAIAGPGAGIAAASGVIAENERIEARNANMRKQYIDTAAKITSKDNTEEIRRLLKEIEKLKDELTPLENEYNELSKKVVLNVSQSELQKRIAVSKMEVKTTKSGILRVSLRVQNDYTADVPEGVFIVLDGVFTINIYCDEVLVGTTYMPLPMYGIKAGNYQYLDTLCTKRLEGERVYRAEISSANLWAMER